MTGLFVTFIITFVAAIVLILLSFTPWAHQNLRWITSITFYIILGAIIGMSSMGAAILVAEKLKAQYLIN